MKPNTLKLSVGLVALALLGVFGLFHDVQSSVEYGNEYQASMYTSTKAGTSSIKSLAGTVGSIVVASTSPTGSAAGPYIAFYDTSSTTVSTTTMTPVFSFGGSAATTPPAGTYTFDVAFGQGIYVWTNPSFNGSYVITYR